MIPPSGYLRRVIFTFALVAIPLMIGLLFTYDVIKIYWNPGMVIQISIGYQEGPRKWAPNEAIPVAGPAIPQDITEAVNPVPADATSLQRGQLLFERNCVPCHGAERSGGWPDHPLLEGRYAQAGQPDRAAHPDRFRCLDLCHDFEGFRRHAAAQREPERA